MLREGAFAAAVVSGYYQKDAVGDHKVDALERLRPFLVIFESDAFTFDHALSSKTISLYQGKRHKTSLKWGMTGEGKDDILLI